MNHNDSESAIRRVRVYLSEWCVCQRVGELVSKRVGEWAIRYLASQRVGEKILSESASGRVGDLACGRVSEWASW